MDHLNELIMRVNSFRWRLVLIKSEAPVELLDTLISTLGDFVDGCKTR